MGKAAEQRTEKRLRYRWHARFALSPKQKPLSGQMVDVSSKGMALLYHNDESCPGPDQLISTNFGVPYFDSGDSFDTVFFNRIGRVCRIDNLTSKVNRIAIQFAEPLFFKPGEQEISDYDAKQRLEAKTQLIVNEKEKPETKTPPKGKTETDTEENTGLYSEALARAEERIRSYAEAKAQAELKLKAEIEARHKSETKLLAESEKKIRSYAEAKARAEEKAKAETKARAKAEAKAKSEARLRAKAEKKAQAEAEKRVKIEAELQKKSDLYAEQLTKIKAGAAQEIANIKAEVEDTLTKIKAEHKTNMPMKKTTPKKNARDKAKSTGEGILMDKVDKIITDRSRIF